MSLDAAALLGWILLLVLVYFAVRAYFIEPHNVEVKRQDVWSPNVPKALDGVCVVFLTDLHLREFGDDQRRVIQAVREADPDLICFGGDYIDDPKDLQFLVPYVMELCKGRRAYGVLGNHDFQERIDTGRLAEDLMRAGMRLLRNDSATVRLGRKKAAKAGEAGEGAAGGRGNRGANEGGESGTSKGGEPGASKGREPGANEGGKPGGGQSEAQMLEVVGVDDPHTGRAYVTKALERVNQARREGRFVLMIAHSPDVLLDPAATRADLILAGHTHGGQVRLPGIGPLMTNSKIGRRADAGLNEVDGTQVYVSKGLGHSMLPLRLFCRPEVSVLTLRRSG